MRSRLYLAVFAILVVSFAFSGCARKAGPLTIVDVADDASKSAIMQEEADKARPSVTSEEELRQSLMREKEKREAMGIYGDATGVPGAAHDAIVDVFFDYDRYSIRPSETAALKKDIKFYKDYPKTKIIIEGHCDERGSMEYNIALGQRRADAVRTYLIDAGISADRISTVSYGKERPFCTTHDEECWQLNRRGHFIVKE